MKEILIILLFILSIGTSDVYSKFKDERFRVKLNDKGQFIDDYGRVRMFHGFNSVVKGFPWYDKQMLNVTRLKLFKEWGFNVVRLGTMWTGVMPTETFINETYLEVLQNITSALDQYGIYSLLDMHQDVISSKFNGYDGAPLWLIDKFPTPGGTNKFPSPLNPNQTYNWPLYYFTFAASDSFQQLYKSDIAFKYWSEFWVKVAQTFANHKSIIGYELINEPWLGNFYDIPEILLPGNAGKENLLPVYDKLVEQIRHVDTDTLIFYEPVTYGAYYPSTGSLGTGFDRVPGGDSQRNRSVLSYHYYCFFLNDIPQENNYSEWLRSICDEIFAKSVFKSAKRNIETTGGGSFLTEFGLCSPDGNPESINTVECEAVLNLADEFYQSFTYWDSSFFDDKGNPRSTVLQAFARPYPTALQGQPLHFSFNMWNGSFELSFSIDLTIKGPTEIFLPLTVHYPKGFRNETIPKMGTKLDKDNFIFSVFSLPDIKQNSTITIKIDPVL